MFSFSKACRSSPLPGLPTAVVGSVAAAVATAVYLSPAVTSSDAPAEKPPQTSASPGAGQGSGESDGITPDASSPSARRRPRGQRPRPTTSRRRRRSGGAANAVTARNPGTQGGRGRGEGAWQRPDRDEGRHDGGEWGQDRVNVPSKQDLIKPAKKYYGLAEDGLPGSGTLFDSLDAAGG